MAGSSGGRNAGAAPSGSLLGTAFACCCDRLENFLGRGVAQHLLQVVHEGEIGLLHVVEVHRSIAVIAATGGGRGDRSLMDQIAGLQPKEALFVAARAEVRGVEALNDAARRKVMNKIHLRDDGW